MFEVDGVDLKGRGFWELQALSLDEAKELMSKDFGRGLVKLAVAHMTHFTFGVVNSTGDAEIRSATCFFLKTTSKLLVVTAKHVISAYRQALTEDPATRCQIGSLPFKPEDRLVGVGTKADIATLSISEGEVEEVKAKAGMPVWRRDEQDGQSYALRLTAAGAKAIAVNPDDDASPTGDEERSPTEGDQAPTSAESDRTAAGVLVAPSAQALATPRTPRVGTKLATAIELLRATEGATVGELSQAMCWLPLGRSDVERGSAYRIAVDANAMQAGTGPAAVEPIIGAPIDGASDSPASPASATPRRSGATRTPRAA